MAAKLHCDPSHTLNNTALHARGNHNRENENHKDTDAEGKGRRALHEWSDVIVRQQRVGRAQVLYRRWQCAMPQ